MLDWLIITADRADAGRGVQGYALAWFLRTYFGRRRVGMISPRRARRTAERADTLLVGLPTSLSGDELERLIARGPYRRVAVYDYVDQQQQAWTAEQQAVLRPVTQLYLKPWYDPAWTYGVPMGLLPIRRYGRFTAAVMWDRARRTAGARRPPAEYDVAFVGRPNFTRMIVDGREVAVPQRVQWISEIKRQAPELRFWGGLVELSAEVRERLRPEFGDVSDLLHTSKKVDFPTYYRAMRRSRVLLAPGGNVPWTYRHYECLYAGGVVVTLDFRERDMLVPLPRENMVHVADGASALPAVRQALEISRTRPTLAEENYAYLERYFRFGAYSRRRPALIERFVQQFA